MVKERRGRERRGRGKENMVKGRGRERRVQGRGKERERGANERRGRGE